MHGLNALVITACKFVRPQNIFWIIVRDSKKPTVFTLFCFLTLNSLGDLNISVVDEFDEVVYQKTVSATAGSSLIIDTDEWEGGEYSIHICNVSKQCLEGSFVIIGDDE